MSGRECELWVIQSESNIDDGGLAYWGPYDDEYQARRMAEVTEGAALVWVPRPGPAPDGET